MDTSQKKIIPVLKWVGGKRKIEDIILSASKNIGSPFTYYEPFFGGGSIFFSLYSQELIKYAYLNDVVPQVVNFYKVISDNDARNRFKKETKKIEAKFNNLNADIKKRKQQYEKLRENFNDSWESFLTTDLEKNPTSQIKLASQFLALNKLGFNGMFRLNSKGRFNIPMGSAADKNFFDENNLDAVGNALSKVEFSCNDYSNVRPFKGRGRKAKNNLIFLDPPYIPNSKTASFTDYSVEGFNLKSHLKLSNDLSKLIENKNNNIIFTNNFNEMSLKLFVNRNKENKRLNAYKFNVTKTISGKNTGRGNTEELLISTFPINNERLEKI